MFFVKSFHITRIYKINKFGQKLYQALFDYVKICPTPFLALHNLHIFLDILELRVENKNKKHRKDGFHQLVMMWLRFVEKKA